MDIIKLPSKNYRERTTAPTKIVIHAIGEYIAQPDKDVFCVDYLEQVGLSSHFYVTPVGSVIGSVAVSNRAFHARGHNNDSIGIELIVPGSFTYDQFIKRINYSKWWNLRQRAAAIELCQRLFNTYETLCTMHRHSDLDPDRKQDPGEVFPWKEFKNEVYKWRKS